MQTSSISFIDSLHADIRQAFYDHHDLAARVMHFILPLCPFVGVYLMGAPGGVFGLTLFLLGYYLTPYAWSATHDHRAY